MAYWNGLGGHITVGIVTLSVTKHTVRKTARLAETTNSGNTATSFGKVIPHYEWEVEGVWDDAVLPDTDGGLDEGASVTITFADGSSGQTCTLTGTSVETLEEVEDVREDVIRWVARGKGGTLTRQTG